MHALSSLLLAATLLAATSASAQITFRLGLRGGANRAISTLSAAGRSGGDFPFGYSADKSAIYAWQVGVVLEARRGKLAFQPALVFSQKGEKCHTTSYLSGVAGLSYFEVSSTNRYNWLEEALLIRGTHAHYGPAWTLEVEVAGSLLLPFLVLILRHDQRLFLGLLAVLLVLGGKFVFWGLFLFGLWGVHTSGFSGVIWWDEMLG